MPRVRATLIAYSAYPSDFQYGSEAALLKPKSATIWQWTTSREIASSSQTSNRRQPRV